MVEFEAEGRQGNGYLVSPEKPRGAVLVLHAWWGLNDFFKSFSNRLSSQGFVVLAPDLHDGGLAKTVAEAKELKSKIADERIKKIVLGAAEYLRSIPPVSGRKIGVVGFSMGAAWSLLLSTLKPENVGAVVVFYGSYPIDFSKAEPSYLGPFAPMMSGSQLLTCVRRKRRFAVQERRLRFTSTGNETLVCRRE